ncbi:MAG: sugar kinase [Christensenellaceae bacterium]|jgi:2-dehydro-3-deoxygluconokinase|nr:sugar kinase [Christensenellaceae bacterium]
MAGNKVLTYGEIMLRLQPPGYARLSQAHSFDINYGGAEANFAVSLANFGIDATFFTKIPKGLLGDACLASLNSLRVETKHILRGGERLGIYYVEKGVAQRPSVVIYDRKNSAINDISEAEISDEKLEEIFKDIRVFHFTGITAALSDSVRRTLIRLLEVAKKHAVIVSCDLNYRKALWDRSTACATMTELMRYVNILISNEDECRDVFGLEAENTNTVKGTLNIAGYEKLAKKLHNKFNSLDYIAFTLRGSISASVNKWSAILSVRGECFRSREYEIDIVDRIGSGDAFCAGLIAGIINPATLGFTKQQQVIEFATAASCLKHTIEGDFNRVSLDDVLRLIAGDGSGRVIR